VITAHSPIVELAPNQRDLGAILLLWKPGAIRRPPAGKEVPGGDDVPVTKLEPPAKTSLHGTGCLRGNQPIENTKSSP
jgi:hypothetical protein